MSLHNKTLLLSSWWKLYTQPNTIWSYVGKILLAKAAFSSTPMLWNSMGSFFWKQIRQLRYLFQFSTYWRVNNGAKVSLWFDNWRSTPICAFGFEDNPIARPFITIRRAHNEINSLFPTPRLQKDEDICNSLTAIQWNSRSDEICCRWKDSSNFPSAAVYKLLASAGKIKWEFAYVRRVPTTPTVRMFLFFLLKDRLLTLEVLQRRNIFSNPVCVLCASQLLESSLHLFFQCPYAKACWSAL